MAKKSKNNKDIPQKSNVSKVSADELIWLEMQEEERQNAKSEEESFKKPGNQPNCRVMRWRDSRIFREYAEKVRNGQKNSLRAPLVEKAVITLWKLNDCRRFSRFLSISCQSCCSI